MILTPFYFFPGNRQSDVSKTFDFAIDAHHSSHFVVHGKVVDVGGLGRVVSTCSVADDPLQGYPAGACRNHVKTNVGLGYIVEINSENSSCGKYNCMPCIPPIVACSMFMANGANVPDLTTFFTTCCVRVGVESFASPNSSTRCSSLAVICVECGGARRHMIRKKSNCVIVGGF